MVLVQILGQTSIIPNMPGLWRGHLNKQGNLPSHCVPLPSPCMKEVSCAAHEVSSRNMQRMDGRREVDWEFEGQPKQRPHPQFPHQHPVSSCIALMLSAFIFKDITWLMCHWSFHPLASFPALYVLSPLIHEVMQEWNIHPIWDISDFFPILIHMWMITPLM